MSATLDRSMLPCHPASAAGSSLIEVLMAIVIVSFGLLGLAALQGKATVAELESYERGQALVLLEDIASRIRNNPANAGSYVVTGTPLGTGNTTYSGTCVPDPANPPPRAEVDKCEWSQLLQGSTEKNGSQKLGAMANARGCIEATGNAREYRVTVAWQGTSDTVAPPAGLDCAEGMYDSDASRRVIATTILIPDLAAL